MTRRQTYRGPLGPVLLGAGAALLLAAWASAEDAEALCRRAKQLKDAGELQAAAAAYREATRVDPQSAEAHWGLGWACVGLGLRVEAATEFLAVLDVTNDPELAEECRRTLERMGIKPPPPRRPDVGPDVPPAATAPPGHEPPEVGPDAPPADTAPPTPSEPPEISVAAARELAKRGETFRAVRVLRALIAEDVDRGEAERLLGEVKRGRREVRVRAVADPVFRSLPEWETRLRARFAAAGEHFARQVPIDLTLVAIDPWEPQSMAADGLAVVDDLRASVSLEGADVVLAFVAERREAPPGAERLEVRGYTLGLAPCFTGYAVVSEVVASREGREWRVPEEQLCENLVHELGHLFGAVHVRGQSVMRADPGTAPTFDFDPLNLEVIRTCRWVDFSQHFASLAPDELEKLAALYGQLAEGPATDDGVHFYRAVALTFADRYEEAVAEYERVLSVAWEDPYTHFNKAELHAKLGDLVRARAHWKVAASLGKPSEVVQRARDALARTRLDGG